MPTHKKPGRAKSLAGQLKKLEESRTLRGPQSAAQVERLLKGFQNLSFRNTNSLLRFHDSLLFLRAFPQSAEVARRADSLLGTIVSHVARLRESGASLESLDSEKFSGIAGTCLTDTFTYEVALWLARRFPQQIKAAWDFDEQARRLGAALPRFLPLLDDDSLVEADTPFAKWMEKAGGKQDAFSWLIEQIARSPIPVAHKTELYDALGIELDWELENSRASRTLARRDVGSLFLHTEPLLRRNQVSLKDELAAAPLEVRKLDREEGEAVLDMCREAVTVRYRELYGTTRGDPESVHEARVGRGVQIFLWGLPPGRRLPLRAYHAGFTLKNGVPVNYIEGISLFEWMEVGFNTFYAYRDGETAWIYAKVLHFLHQLTGVTCISVYPYQLGHENEEAIQSGAFWFYRKLGFRPGRRDLLALTEKEEQKIAKRRKYRTSPQILRRLAAGHVFYEFGPEAHGAWDSFSTRNFGFAVQQRMAEKFAGNADAILQSARVNLENVLKVDSAELSAEERSAFDTFAFAMSLVPDLPHWSHNDKQALLKIILAKADPDETIYLRLLQRHARLREEFLRLGSQEREQGK